MRILIIDGQGGGIGGQLVAAIREQVPDSDVTAAGTNTIATSVMLKAGAHHAATGENAVVVGCRKAEVIAGPIGILVADALLGETTPAIAAAVGQSQALKILIPTSHCGVLIAGMADQPVSRLIQDAVAKIRSLGLS